MQGPFRHILITGASSGIGRALAIAFAGQGVFLSLGGRDAKRLSAVAETCRNAGARVEAKAVDVRDRMAMADWIMAADALAPLDLVVAGAGITSGLGPGRKTESPESVRAVFAINVDGVFNTVEPALALMLARGTGRVAVIGSIAAYRALPYSPAYCASKAAVHAYADALRAGLADTGVGVTLIAPGFVRTPLNAGITAPRPLELDDQRAAAIIRRGLTRGRGLIAFPFALYAGTRLLAFLPARVVDAVMRRIRVDVPETGER